MPKKPNIGLTADGDFDSDFWNDENIIAFLHGHVGFVPTNRGAKFEEDYGKAQHTRIENMLRDNGLGVFRRDGIKGFHSNSYFVSGLDKMEAFSENPFAGYMARFAMDTVKSDYLVLIGFSLSDLHLYPFLTHALNNRFARRKKVIFVCWDFADKICDDFKKNLTVSDPKTKLLIMLRASITTKGWNAHLGNLKKSLNASGAGKLADKVLIYNWGTESFIEEDIYDLWNIIM